MHTLENPRTRWRGLITLGFIITFCLSGAVFTAQAAEARTFYAPPSKSWICKTFNICKTGTVKICGNPNIAYNKTNPPCRTYQVRY